MFLRVTGYFVNFQFRMVAARTLGKALRMKRWGRLTGGKGSLFRVCARAFVNLGLLSVFEWGRCSGRPGPLSGGLVEY